MKSRKTDIRTQARTVISRLLAATMFLLLTGIVDAETLETNTQSTGKRPNIVVMMADDLGLRDIGCYGGPVKTPALDGLAAKGMRFTDFHSGCAVCSPSRAVLLTGRNNIRAGVYHVIPSTRPMHLLEREVTIAEILKEQGYDTAHIGKWHLGMPRKNIDKPAPDQHGFDYWFGTENNASPSHKNPVNFFRNGTPQGKIEGYASQIVVDDAISWLDKQQDSDAPFFLNIWFHEPHAPIAAPDEIVSEYGELDDPAAVYNGTIDNTDRAIKRLLAKLKEVDSVENTLIVYASDHGSYRPDRAGNLRGTKGSNFEGGIRSPGIFYWPGTILSGHLEDEPTGMVDLLPTICGLLDIDKPEGVHLDGSDISALLTGRKSEFTRHQPLFWLLPTSGPSMSLRDGKYAMVAYRDYEVPRDQEAMDAIVQKIRALMPDADEKDKGGGGFRSSLYNSKYSNPEAERLRGQYLGLFSFQNSWIPMIKAGGYKRFELYDLDTDPGQQTNVMDQYPEVAARLKKQMLEISASVMADGPIWE